MKPPDQTSRALPAGALVNEFEFEEVIDEDGATITYAATDRSRAVPVAIAEYMPARIAQRNDAAQVTPRTFAHADAFAKGLKAFRDETRTLAQCAHPALLGTLGLFEANATAYRVMPRYMGERLLEVRRSMVEPPDEGAVRALLDALLGALEVFHRTGGFHGKVTPSNILLLADNRPLLLSPGAADRAIASDRIDALMTSLEPLFAPVEQILESDDTPPHPSVDLYALAGVARYWISGQLPGPAFATSDTAPRERLADIVQRLRLTWPRLHYSAPLLDTLESALSIYPAERPQSVAQMRANLGAAPPIVGGLVGPSTTAALALNDEVPSSPARLAGAARDLDRAMIFEANRDSLATDTGARIDDDRSTRADFVRQVPRSRPVAVWSGIVVLLVALMPVGLYEFRQERQIVPTSDDRGITRGVNADSATESTSAVGPAAPVTPPSAPDAETNKSKSTETTVAGSAASTTESATESASLASANPAATGPPAEPAAVAQPPAPSPTPSRVAQQPASRPAMSPTPSRVVQQPASRVPSSPRAACGSRTRFSLYRCMQTQCSQRQWASHPQCEHLRATDSVE